MTTRFDLFTANYPRFLPTMGTPIRTSNGYPRFKLAYDLRYAIKELMPDRATMKLPKPEFDTAYREKLDGAGVDKLASRFRALVVAEDDPRLVILCFENVSIPGKWCHRTVFAHWWTERTGDEVRELGPVQGPEEPPHPALF